ncbi:DNA replication and repair protein RecF [Lewinellaceae bacterium SD302]|nr:DNA replication and repair protein RecF [Lewinellaceae bacterium SD302]
MLLTRFLLTNFKNYDYQLVDCAGRFNCFVGENGSGKTNLLEAIYYLCMGKAYDSSSDQYAVQHGEDFFRLEGRFSDGKVKGSEDRIALKVQKRKRKVIERNGKAYDRLADHVGRYPVVIVVPDDVRLVHEGSEYRRRLLNNSLSQTDPVYLEKLLTYNKVLSQRNALLKQAGGQPLSGGLLEIYDQQLLEPASYIHAARQAFVKPFTEQLRAAQVMISNEKETVGLRYRSQLNDQSMEELLAERTEKDRILQRTSGGIHRDDLVFTQEDHPLKKVASQGQLKTFVLSLKLAQYHLLRQQSGKRPLLLLDDIFDKLDSKRVTQLLQLINQPEEYGQIFISDTDPERMQRLLASVVETDYAQFRVAAGSLQTEVKV